MGLNRRKKSPTRVKKTASVSGRHKRKNKRYFDYPRRLPEPAVPAQGAAVSQ